MLEGQVLLRLQLPYLLAVVHSRANQHAVLVEQQMAETQMKDDHAQLTALTHATALAHSMALAQTVVKVVAA